MPSGPVRSSLRLLATLGLAGALTMSAAACGAGNGGRITVGVPFDQPGLGMKKPDGTMSGFNVDVARYVALHLGYSPDDITWLETPPGQREMLIRNGQVDYIVASYTITEARKQKVGFAGPYLIAGQSLLVRTGETGITGAQSLQNNKKLCSVAGSTPAQRIKDRFPGVQLQRYDTYSACVEALRNGAIDAVTTDDVILAGYAAQRPGSFKLVGAPFSAEEYGIGLRQQNTTLRDNIDDALEKMEQDGSWNAAFEKHLGASGYPTPRPPQINRY
jgi:glutamate transport system substrate-binding protein